MIIIRLSVLAIEGGDRAPLKQSILMRGFICTPHETRCCKTRKEFETRDLRKKTSRLFSQYDRRLFAAKVFSSLRQLLLRRFAVRTDVRDFPDRDQNTKKLDTDILN